MTNLSGQTGRKKEKACMKKTTMKLARTVTAIVLALALAAGAVPFTGGAFVTDASAAQTDYFDGTGVASGSTLSGWTWSSTPNTYKYNSSWSNALEIWNSSSATRQFYTTVSSLPAGTYSLQYTYYAGSSVTIQPYINGSAEGDITSIESSSLTEVTVEYEFTTDEDISDGEFGLQFVFGSSGWAHINYIYLYGVVGSYAYAGTYETPAVTVKTTAQSVSYPETITIDLVNEEAGTTSTEDVEVTWTDTSSVDIQTAGTYEITGEFEYDGETYECVGLVYVIESTNTGSGTSDFEGVTYNGVLVNGGDMIKGVDVSSLISVENSGVKFYNDEGEETDVLEILADAGVNYVRMRIWNDPYRSSASSDSDKTAANSYGGGVCDINYAVALAERCAKYGIKYFVSFHYSDWWSDPSRSIVPKAWSGYTVSEKADAISEFTTECLEKIAETGVDIGMVSVGNETTNYMAGERGISTFAPMIAAGCEAVREFDPNILIAVHFTNPETWNYASSFASVLEANDVDYDVFSSSYYPFWHGSLSNLESKLEAVTEGYGKITMITEFSYPYTLEDLDGDAITVSSLSSSVSSVFGSASEEGQYQAIQTMLDYVSEITDCIGVFYWEPAWLSVYTSSSENESLWAQYGSGWTTAYSAEYDSSNGSSTVGGSGVDNQALFDMEGSPLYSITNEVFNESWTDGYEPLLSDVMAQQTTSTYTYSGSECISVRFVGIIDGLSYSKVGFKIIAYDEDGEALTSLANQSTTYVYRSITADGVTMTPDEGYYFTYVFKNISADETYYFMVIPYSASLVGTADNANIYQKGYKYYKVENGILSAVSELGE